MDTRTAAQHFADTWQQAWTHHDIDALAGLYADHAVHTSMPFRPPHHGKAAILDYIRWSFDGETPITVTFHTPLVDADRAAIEFHVHALDGDQPTVLAGCVFARFDPDGLAVETRDYWHTHPEPCDHTP
ncbi:nuclear transport factor 2 family protein [Nonomuraea sp. NPDC003727]